MSAFNEAVFFPAFKAAGFLERASVKQSGVPAVNVDVRFDKPDNELGGSLSHDYQIEYQFADLPSLAVGDIVTMLDADDVPVSGGKYRVRTPAVVNNDPGDSRTGFFRHALLTKV